MALTLIIGEPSQYIMLINLQPRPYNNYRVLKQAERQQAMLCRFDAMLFVYMENAVAAYRNIEQQL